MAEYHQRYIEFEQTGPPALATKIGSFAIAAVEQQSVEPPEFEPSKSSSVVVVGACEQQSAGELSPALQAPSPDAMPESAEPSKPKAGFWTTLASLLLPNAVADPARRDKSPAELIEKRGYARVASRFADLVEDESRKNTFRRDRYGDDRDIMTEHDGLVELRDFLKQAAKKGNASGTRSHAKSMLENLTFIGEKEYAEGAAGLAAYWKQFLDSDPEAQICALAKISSYSSSIKSDRYLLERILRNFSDEELQKYAGRLVLDPSLLRSSPEKVRVALLDDWTISGSQMADACSSAHYCVDSRYMGSLELNLLTVSPKRMSRGFKYGRTIPIKAYFLAHDVKGPADYGAYISGTHSSVDYDFRDDLHIMSYEEGMSGPPRLASVKRQYGRRLPRTEYLASLAPKS